MREKGKGKNGRDRDNISNVIWRSSAVGHTTESM
jgi:hypothetical protein